MAKFLVLCGVLLIALGLLLHFRIEIPWLTQWIGRLPGDLVLHRNGLAIYFPFTSALLISMLLSLVFRNVK